MCIKRKISTALNRTSPLAQGVMLMSKVYSWAACAPRVKFYYALTPPYEVLIFGFWYAIRRAHLYVCYLDSVAVPLVKG